jgi:predicted DCC family thiol-disulfide oxidoreductase YuxK
VADDGRDVVLYDGVCALCDGFTRFVLPRDPAGRFRFAPLQSEFARRALARHGRDAAALDTLYVLVDHGRPAERVLERSRAALHVVARLRSPWRLLGLLRIVPRGLLDRGYDRVARDRYRRFGRHEACIAPRPEYRERFIEG